MTCMICLCMYKCRYVRDYVSMRICVVGTDKSNDFDHFANRLRLGPKLPSLWERISRTTSTTLPNRLRLGPKLRS